MIPTRGFWPLLLALESARARDSLSAADAERFPRNSFRLDINSGWFPPLLAKRQGRLARLGL